MTQAQLQVAPRNIPHASRMSNRTQVVPALLAIRRCRRVSHQTQHDVRVERCAGEGTVGKYRLHTNNVYSRLPCVKCQSENLYTFFLHDAYTE